MPTYEYRCNECGHELEVRQSFKDEALVDCPSCKMAELERVISGGLGSFMRKDPTTLGHQAERNTSKMGKYELQEKRKYQEESGNAAHQKALEEAGVIKDYKPFYGKPTKDLSKLNKKQQKRYILEGK
jgi:putative FmdB family regulatory protein